MATSISKHNTVGLWSGSSGVEYAALRLAIAVALAADTDDNDDSSFFSGSSSNPVGTCGEVVCSFKTYVKTTGMTDSCFSVLLLLPFWGDRSDDASDDDGAPARRMRFFRISNCFSCPKLMLSTSKISVKSLSQMIIDLSVGSCKLLS